jgi:hypothetical protein
MGTAADDVLVAAGAHIGEKAGDNDCAKFVTQAFREAGHSSAFSGSNWVPSIAAQFSGAQVSTDLSTAKRADLIDFGSDDHIMIYSGNDMVVGTAGSSDSKGNLIPGTTYVVQKLVASITPGFSKVLHTGMDTGSGSGSDTSTTGGGSETVQVDFGSRIRADYKSSSAAAAGTVDPDPKLTDAWRENWIDGVIERRGQGGFDATYTSPSQSPIYQPLKAASQAYVGSPISQLPASLTVTLATRPAGATLGVPGLNLGDPLGAIFGNFAWVPGLLLNAGIVVFAAVLVYAGLRQTVEGIE